MPDEVCAEPTGDGNPNNRLKSLSVEGYTFTPTFSLYTTEYDLIVENNVSKVTVKADALADNASVSGTGEHNLSVGNNKIVISVTAENGDVEEYTINIVRKATDSEPDNNPVEENGFTCTYDIDENNSIISGISVGSTASDVISNITFKNGCYGKISGADGKEKTSQKISTGDTFIVYTKDGSRSDLW